LISTTQFQTAHCFIFNASYSAMKMPFCTGFNT
jgi:hypothetical protein